MEKLEFYKAWLYYALRREVLTQKTCKQNYDTFSCRNALCPFSFTVTKDRKANLTRIEFAEYNHNHKDDATITDLIKCDVSLYIHNKKAGKEYSLTIKDDNRELSYYTHLLSQYYKNWSQTPHKFRIIMNYFYKLGATIQDMINYDKEFVKKLEDHFKEDNGPLVLEGESFYQGGQLLTKQTVDSKDLNARVDAIFEGKYKRKKMQSKTQDQQPYGF